MYAKIEAIDFYLPESVLTNSELAAESDSWTAEKIQDKTGISQRHISQDNEFSSDLAYNAAVKLLRDRPEIREQIDFLVLCTQTPDYLLPTTACLVHNRLGLTNDVGALDVNLGCSGYVYCLSLVKGLIESEQAKCVLLITADTYSKLLQPEDLSVRTLFGDASSATIVTASAESLSIGPFVHGTDGSGGSYLMTHGGALKGNETGSPPVLKMDGPSIFVFTLDAVPKLVHGLLKKAEMALDEIDLFVFHQANSYMLEHLRKKLQIKQESFFVAMENCGNTVSSSIPVALKMAEDAGRLKAEQTVMLVGFGVGLSWSATILKWSK